MDINFNFFNFEMDKKNYQPLSKTYLSREKTNIGVKERKNDVKYNNEEYNLIQNEIDQDSIAQIIKEELSDFFTSLGNLLKVGLNNTPPQKNLQIVDLSQNNNKLLFVEKNDSHSQIEQVGVIEDLTQSTALVFSIKDGKFYYKNSKGENVEFEYDSGLAEKYRENGNFKSEDEKLHAKAAYDYFNRMTTEKIDSMSVKELAGDRGIPTSVSQEEYNKILEKLNNYEIPSDYELAQIKFYEHELKAAQDAQKMTQEAQKVMNTSALNNITRNNDGSITYVFGDGMSNNPTLNSITVAADGTVNFNGQTINMTAEDIENFNKKCSDELKSLMAQSQNVTEPIPTSYGETLTTYYMNNSKDYINYIVDADGRISIKYMTWDASKNRYVETKSAHLNY